MGDGYNTRANATRSFEEMHLHRLPMLARPPSESLPKHANKTQMLRRRLDSIVGSNINPFCGVCWDVESGSTRFCSIPQVIRPTNETLLRIRVKPLEVHYRQSVLSRLLVWRISQIGSCPLFLGISAEATMRIGEFESNIGKAFLRVSKLGHWIRLIRFVPSSSDLRRKATKRFVVFRVKRWRSNIASPSCGFRRDVKPGSFGWCHVPWDLRRSNINASSF